MTDNATATDASGLPVTFRTRERTGVHTAMQAMAFEADDGSEQIAKPSNPLPATDTATQAKLDTLATQLTAVIAALGNLLTELNAKTEPTQTQAISAAALPLPSGAATSALQGTGNASLASIDGKVPALSGGKVPVTDPTVLPLPTGASTESTLASIYGRMPILEDTSTDLEPPAAGIAAPSESYGMVFDDVTGTWSRQRGNIVGGTEVYSDDLAAILYKLTTLLTSMNSKLPPITNFREMPVRLTTQSSVNIAIGGTAVSASTGVSGTGTPRVTPANDTIAGIPHIYALNASLTAPGRASFRSFVTT